jgi:hypothetical protein
MASTSGWSSGTRGRWRSGRLASAVCLGVMASSAARRVDCAASTDCVTPRSRAPFRERERERESERESEHARPVHAVLALNASGVLEGEGVPNSNSFTSPPVHAL